MVTKDKTIRILGFGCTFSENYYGLSTDEKPSGVNVKNGSRFVEMDSNKLYFYDAANAAWLEWGENA